MPIVRTEDVATELFSGGATYRTLVGDATGTTPVRIGIQTSPPGYSTGIHWHPYLEIVTVLEGEGVAWIEGEGDEVAISPGMTMIFPPNVRHRFEATGDSPLVTYGVHASPDRVVERAGDGTEDGGG